MFNKPILVILLLTLNLTLILTIAFPLTAATPSADHPLTLSELIDMALENHPSTKQAWWSAKRAASALGSAKSAYYPQVGFEAFASNGRTFKFVNGPDTEYTLLGTDITLSMLLYDWGEREAAVHAAKMALLAANWQTDWNIQKIMVKVLENAYAALHAREVYEAAVVSLNEAEVVWESARELNHAGLTPITDVYISRANLSQMKIEASRQKAMLDVQMGKLTASLGLPANSCIEIGTISLFPAPRKMDIGQLLDLAYQQRSDLMAKQARAAETAAREKQIGASYGPKLTFGGRGGSDHYINDRANGAHYEVRVDFSMPLFTGFDAAYQKRMAFADSKISMEELAELQLDISLEVLTHSRTLEAAQEILPDADEYLANSIRAYEGVLEKYKAGKERITELSMAQQQLAEARVRYSDVKTRWFVSLANLAYATGTLSPYMEKK